ncbi:MAG TPA: type I restriction enzyme endonuclease domain-containing protein [Thermoleophilaceae bacterium]|nr:type I restriction enzyme endonuclease domain-containing protein [Thermoleophilaceae bacterium]
MTGVPDPAEDGRRAARLHPQSAPIDWTLKESVRAAMRTKVRRLLTKRDDPPDLEQQTFEQVPEQAELFASTATESAA